VAGGNVVISSAVAGDVVAVGGSVHLAPGSSVTGDLIAAGGTLRIDGEVTGDVRVAGGKLFINAPVGPVEAMVEGLTLGSAANVRGDLIYQAQEEATVEEGATIAGATTFTRVERGGDFNFGATFAAVKLLALLLLGLVLLWLFPRPTRGTTLSALASPWQQLLRGFIALVVAPIAAIILCVTVVGIPFGLILLAAYFVTLILAGLLMSFVLGAQLERWIWRRRERGITWGTLLIGVAAGAILSFIPIVGWAVVFVFYLFTLGALTQAWQKRIWTERR
jgi:hypothetical protein